MAELIKLRAEIEATYEVLDKLNKAYEAIDSPAEEDTRAQELRVFLEHRLDDVMELLYEII